MPEGWGSYSIQSHRGVRAATGQIESRASDPGAGHWPVEAAMAEKGGPGGCEAALGKVWISTSSSALATHIKRHDSRGQPERKHTALLLGRRKLARGRARPLERGAGPIPRGRISCDVPAGKNVRFLETWDLFKNNHKALSL